MTAIGPISEAVAVSEAIMAVFHLKSRIVENYLLIETNRPTDELRDKLAGFAHGVQYERSRINEQTSTERGATD